eukprot:5006800-Pleurochrysis_carterae.AAC.1
MCEGLEGEAPAEVSCRSTARSTLRGRYLRYVPVPGHPPGGCVKARALPRSAILPGQARSAQRARR